MSAQNQDLKNLILQWSKQNYSDVIHTSKIYFIFKVVFFL